MRQAIGLSLALWAVSGLAIAKQAIAADDRHPPHSVKTKAAKTEHPAARHASGRQRSRQPAEPDRRHAAARHRSTEPRGEDRLADRPSTAAAAPAVKVLGQREVGIAAWYGGRFIGRRTSSGSVLDNVRATAAHRSLPLNSLVRITNLKNGRSVICTVTDRGPWGANRLIDVSPRAADELDMKRSGIARVAVEPVASAKASAE
jgi:rare lipoprotein A (peptidoglycan hydrolase)